MAITLKSDINVELIKHNCADIDVARAAWVSNFGSDAREKDSERVEGLINFLVRERHWSPVEHNSLTVFVEVPIFVSREVVRHRTFSYNEWSGRYAQLEPVFYMPERQRPLVQQGKVGAYTFAPGSDEQYDEVVSATKEAYGAAWRSYEDMLDAGVAREVARNVLPVGIYTKFYMTGNLRNWFQFFALRSEAQALHEIREMSHKIEDIVKEIAPITYEAWRKHG